MNYLRVFNFDLFIYRTTRVTLQITALHFQLIQNNKLRH